VTIQYCAFCGLRSQLLCDGKLANGRTCDKPICRRCSRMDVHLQKWSKERGRYCDTRDLCPDCVKAGRTVYEAAAEAKS
jgi:hypothetical protein